MSSKTMWRAVAVVAVVLSFVTVGMAQEKPASVAGKWELTSEGRQGPQTSTLTLEQDGENLKGTIAGPRGETPVTGTIKGKSITIVVKRQTPNGEFTQEFKGTVDGSSMKGTVSRGERTSEWTAKKQ